MKTRVLFLGTSHTRGFERAFLGSNSNLHVDFTILSGPLWRLLINQSEIKSSNNQIYLDFFDPIQLASCLDCLDNSWSSMKAKLARFLERPLLADSVSTYTHVIFVDCFFRFDSMLSLHADRILLYGGKPFSFDLLSFLPFLCGGYVDYPSPVNSFPVVYRKDASSSFLDIIKVFLHELSPESSVYLWRMPGFKGERVDHAAHQNIHSHVFEGCAKKVDLLLPPEQILDLKTGRVQPEYEGGVEHGNAKFSELCLEDLMNKICLNSV